VVALLDSPPSYRALRPPRLRREIARARAKRGPILLDHVCIVHREIARARAKRGGSAQLKSPACSD